MGVQFLQVLRTDPEGLFRVMSSHIGLLTATEADLSLLTVLERLHLKMTFSIFKASFSAIYLVFKGT